MAVQTANDRSISDLVQQLSAQTGELVRQELRLAQVEMQEKGKRMNENPKTGAPPDDPEALRKDIADKRRELGDTAAELAAKADVKSQVKEKVEERKKAVREAGHQAQETVTAQASRLDPRLLGAVAVIVLLLVLRRRRR